MMDKKCVTLCVECVIHSHRQMSKVKIFLLLSCFASIMLLQGFVFEKEVTTLNMDRQAIVLYNPSAMFRLQKIDKHLFQTSSKLNVPPVLQKRTF